MEQTGFFALHVDDPRQEEHTPSPERLDETAAATSRYSVHLGWLEGEPYIVDLGSVGQVLVNGTPIAPRTPVALQEGDKITIGNAHLTWQGPGAAGRATQVLEKPRFAKVTVELPREKPEPAESAPPAEERVEPPPAAPAPDETLLVAKRPPAPEAPSADETLLRPREAARPPQAGMPAEPERPPTGVEDETLLASRPETRPPEPQVLDPTLIAPKRSASPPVSEDPDPTLIVAKRSAPPPVPESPRDEAVPRDEAAGMTGDDFTYETVWVDMAKLSTESMDVEFEATTILRDSQTPYLVVHLPDRTWEVQLTQERMTIGRTEDNDVPIPDGSLSRHHAAIEPRGGQYVIVDTQSTNGVWVGRQRVERHQLSAGDVLSLGRAKLVFKGGFTSDDLTLIRPPRIDGTPKRRPVVFVPGLMGSELWIGSEQIWPNLKILFSNPEVYRLPSDPRIEARNIVSDVVIVPNVIKLRQYSGLGDYLVAGLGYERGEDLLEFAYDWRQDVRLAAQSLAETIERWQADAPITIIAHSLGTLVTRYYVERLGGKRLVERIILMGGPHYGAPGGLAALLAGPGMLPMGMGDERLRNVLATFPTPYQILPIYPSVSDQHGAPIDLLNDETWLPEDQRPLLRAARSFRRELGDRSSVPAVSIFGYGLKTKLRATIHRRADGQWQQVEFTEDTAGDSTVPSGSSVLKDSEIHPVFQDHGSLYIDDDVRMRLKVELTRSTTWRRR